MIVLFIVIIIISILIYNCKKGRRVVNITDNSAISFDNPTYTGTYTEDNFPDTDTDTHINENIISSTSGIHSYQDVNPVNMPQYYLDEVNYIENTETDTDYLDISHGICHTTLTTDF